MKRHIAMTLTALQSRGANISGNSGRGIAAILVGILLMCGCGGEKRVAVEGDEGAHRYRRPKIVEVAESDLKMEGQLIDALTLQESGRGGEALSAYSAIVAERGDCAAAWYEMSRLLLGRGWTDSATACIVRATALQPDNTWYRIQQGECARANADKKGVAAAWEEIVRLNPEKLEYYYELSDAWIEAGDIPAAVEVLNRVEKKVGVSESVSLQKQRLWMAVGRADKAERELAALAAAMPQEKRYQAMMAEAMMAKGKFGKAKEYYDRVLRADPNDEYIHIQLAEFYKRQGDLDQADREMQIAFDNPALDCNTKVPLLAQFYTNEEFYGSRSTTCFRLLEEAVRGCADSAQYALVYGDVLMRQNRMAEAAHQLELALTNDSSRYEVWEALIICLSESPSRKAEMLNYAARATRLFPMKSLPCYILAVDEVERRRYADALTRLERGARWGYAGGYMEVECSSLMAECHYRLGQYEKAWTMFDKCIRLQPDNYIVLNNYAYYLAEQGIRLDEAEEMSLRTVTHEPTANNLDTYGWILHLLGRDGEALSYLRRAVSLNPESETLRNHLQAVEKQ